MSILLQILTNEYGNEYDLASKPLFSEPKIYDANGDISKRWYVYYSFRNSKTGKLVRQKPIYKGVNRYKTKSERLELLSKYRKGMSVLLRAGYSPYEEKKISKERLSAILKIKTETKIHNSQKNTVRDLIKILSVNNPQIKTEHIENTNEIKQVVSSENIRHLQTNKLVSVQNALAHAIKIRKGSWSKATTPTMIGHYNKFIKWLEKNKLINIDIRELKKLHISQFLEQLKVQKGKNSPITNASPKTKNNHRATLSSLFSQLSQDDFIDKNFFEDIRILKSTPKKNKAYSDKQVKEIREHLDIHDPYLRIFIQFMSYAFLRNKEVCKIQIKNIDLDAKRIYVATKTGAFDAIPIISELEQVIQKMEIHKYDQEDFLITKYGYPSKWAVEEKSKSGHFSKRFNKIVRLPLKLTLDHTLYSFRHTAALNLYHSIKDEGYSYQEILLKLMPITRHKSKEGLENYLRDIGAFLPKDYGKRYTIEF